MAGPRPRQVCLITGPEGSPCLGPDAMSDDGEVLFALTALAPKVASGAPFFGGHERHRRRFPVLQRPPIPASKPMAARLRGCHSDCLRPEDSATVRGSVQSRGRSRGRQLVSSPLSAGSDSGFRSYYWFLFSLDLGPDGVEEGAGLAWSACAVPPISPIATRAAPATRANPIASAAAEVTPSSSATSGPQN